MIAAPNQITQQQFVNRGSIQRQWHGIPFVKSLIDVVNDTPTQHLPELTEPRAGPDGLAKSTFEQGENSLDFGSLGVEIVVHSGVMPTIEAGELAVFNYRSNDGNSASVTEIVPVVALVA